LPSCCAIPASASPSSTISGSATPRSVLIGGALVFGSSVSYALYLSGSAPMIARLGAMRFSALAMLISTAVTLAHFLAVAAVDRIHPAFAGVWLGSGDGGVCHHRAGFCPVGGDPPAGCRPASLYGMIGPMLTIGFGWWLLNENISFEQMTGAALVVAGILIVSHGSRKARHCGLECPA
jgi:drug/metabolite transporter (DMT)-like permease